MAQIINRVLAIQHDQVKKLANVTVKCDVKFTELELCQMRTCRGLWFKLQCQLWGKDGGFLNPDDLLFVIPTVYYFPDGNPTQIENRAFTITLGEGVLNEDVFGQDEIYAKLILTNLPAGTQISGITNTVHHSF